MSVSIKSIVIIFDTILHEDILMLSTISSHLNHINLSLTCTFMWHNIWAVWAHLCPSYFPPATPWPPHLIKRASIIDRQHLLVSNTHCGKCGDTPPHFPISPIPTPPSTPHKLSIVWYHISLNGSLRVRRSRCRFFFVNIWHVVFQKEVKLISHSLHDFGNTTSYCNAGQRRAPFFSNIFLCIPDWI